VKRCCEENRELDTLALFLLQPHRSLSLKAEKKKCYEQAPFLGRLHRSLFFVLSCCRGKTEYQALEEGRQQPRIEPRIVRYLEFLSSEDPCLGHQNRD